MKLRFLSFALLALLAAAPLSAQSLEADASAGAGYKANEFRVENLFASVEFKGLSFGPAGAAALAEFGYDSGEFKYRIFARGDVQIAGPVYSAVDVKVNGSERDPRLVIGFNFARFKAEAYGQVDGDGLYGFSVRFPLF